MSDIVSIVNLKGGVGKTTITVNLACALAEGGRQVRVVDADTQGTSTLWDRLGSLPSPVHPMPLPERELRHGWLRGLFHTTSKRVLEWQARVQALTADVVLIDCPPNLGLATRSAIWISRLVLVPATGSAADVAATGQVIPLIRKARGGDTGGNPACLLIPARIDRNTATGRDAEAILKQLGEPLGPVIGQRVVFADSMAFGKWIGEYAKGSLASEEIRALTEAVSMRLASSDESDAEPPDAAAARAAQ